MAGDARNANEKKGYLLFQEEMLKAVQELKKHKFKKV
jgi:hypothetical protein